jgi:hypothetical protein
MLQVFYNFLVEFSNFDWDRYCLSLLGPVPLKDLPSGGVTGVRHASCTASQPASSNSSSMCAAVGSVTCSSGASLHSLLKRKACRRGLQHVLAGEACSMCLQEICCMGKMLV